MAQYDIVGSTAVFDSPYDSNGNGWDKSSDINVQAFGTVPEPASVTLLLAGVVGLVGMAGRRKQAV